jgi:hypothetical protein
MYLCSSDESGKTLAIIIGLVAAVAIVIVFLSFLRRAGAVGGKMYTSMKPRVVHGIHLHVLLITSSPEPY